MKPSAMAKLYAKKKSVRAVMTASGHDFYTTKRMIVIGGGTLLPLRRKSKLSKEEIVALYERHSIPQIAKMNGTSNNVVLRVLRDAAVTMRNRGGGVFHTRVKHGHARDAIKLGMTVDRYIRLLAVCALGGECVVCGVTDLRVLDVNHIDGEGAYRRKGNPVGEARYTQLLAVLQGARPANIEVRCANCNRIHEYDRGNIAPIPKEILCRQTSKLAFSASGKRG